MPGVGERLVTAGSGEGGGERLMTWSVIRAVFVATMPSVFVVLGAEWTRGCTSASCEEQILSPDTLNSVFVYVTHC